MNSNKVLSNIKNILKTSSEKVSIFVDGTWGVGKTFLIKNQLFDDQQNEYDFKYVSVFGRKNLKEIENELMMQLLSIKKSETKTSFNELFVKASKDILQNKLGINLSEYINCFSIDTIPLNFVNSKKIILCFDDIERKSKDVTLKNLLGLIERCSKKFHVIIISNISKFNNEDKQLYDEYKEKIFDYEFSITEVNDEVLRKILRNCRSKEDIEYEDRIIEIYKKNTFAFGKSQPGSGHTYKLQIVNNIRIYIKFINLLCRVENEVSKITNNDYNQLDDIFIEACKEIVYNYYSKDKNYNNGKENIDKTIIVGALKKMFLYDEYDINNIKEYLQQHTEIRKDITTLRKVYKINENDFELLLQKIEKKIDDSDIEYFVGQKQIISMLDVLVDLNNTNPYEEKLLAIANRMYLPILGITPNVYNTNEWGKFGMWGETSCNSTTKTFIEKINTSNNIKFNGYIEKQYEEGITQKDIEKIKKVLAHKKVDSLKEFEMIFDFAFQNLIDNYNSEYMSFISSLIQRTKSNLISQYFVKKMRNEERITIKKKYEYFNEILEEKIYREDQDELSQK